MSINFAIYINLLLHDDVIKWKHFPCNWPFLRGIHWSPVNSMHKGPWRGALIFSFICVWVKGWENSREAGDLRRYHAHYDVIVMISRCLFSKHSRRPTARSFGQGLGCLLRVNCLHKIFALLISYCVQYRVIFDRDISLVCSIQHSSPSKLRFCRAQYHLILDWVKTRPNKI